MAASSSAVPWTFGPVNHFRADAIHQIPANPRPRLAVRPLRVGVDAEPRPGDPRRRGDPHRCAERELEQQRPHRGPVGGYKQGGMGRKMGMHEVNLSTEVKNVYLSEE